MRDQEIVSYLNSIDFSLAAGNSVISNIYREIMPFSSSLATDPFASASLEKLIFLSNPSHLIHFLRSLNNKVIYKKLGSRIVECVFKRLFECLYVNGELFYLQDALDFVNPGDCITCHNATHVLRQGLMLLSGKRIDKLNVQKHRIPNVPNSAEDATCGPSTMQGSNAASREDNASYSKRKLQEYKDILKDKMRLLESNDSFTTLGMFLQIVKSQSMIAQLIESDCNVENIKSRSFLYEIIPTIANSRNLELLYSKISDGVMDLCLNERSSYFMQSFLKHAGFGSRMLDHIRLDEFDTQSNIVLSLLESLLKVRDYDGVERLVRDFYRVRKSLFREFLLERHEGIDTKFVGAVVAFMAMPKKHSFGVNEDFLQCFRRDWLKTKAGISLVKGFADGAAELHVKADFFNRNIDLFWESCRWKEGKSFVRKIIAYTSSHSRKKAYEMLGRCK